MKQIEGGICAVRGVRAYGIKDGKMGLAIMVGKGSAVGMFTRNKVIAAPLVVSRQHLSGGKLCGIIANSGGANAFTGKSGLDNAAEMASLLAKKIGCKPEEIGVASTGVIGRQLDMKWIGGHLDGVFGAVTDAPSGSIAAARAIMTTDKVPKEIAVELDCGARIGGIAKGSGMIEPNMGTMLAFIYTDARLEPAALQKCLETAVGRSFNMIVVDGDTSTNDMVLLTATGTLDCPGREFQEGLDFVCRELAKMIVKDGEGATKFFEVSVTGAKTEKDAKLAAKAIVRSPLVKTAIFGKDPNWGRVVAAAGYSGADVEQDGITLRFSGGGEEAVLVENGRIIEGRLDVLRRIMSRPNIFISIDLGLGGRSATAWGCDLSYDYVKINAMYTT
ncbi:MAG TPA: bifunctional ornithine acetyltransferase/N-acetylglutamate synthase [Candidatus Methanoperedenaceae archaeon]|nr:bifunctional ornithine acetyltransferase/N-acetylglutamate synthase [Candidatus Methanoperedenaceae archaeon]